MSAVKASMTLPQLYRPVEAPLEGVREGIDQLWRDALALVSLELPSITHAGGKMLRPALCLLSAGAIEARELRHFVRMAIAFEALHIASLAHDDVIDRAILRRGNASLSGLWDNHAAVLGGDYLVARSVEILAEYDSCPLIANAIRSVRCMAEGELFFFGRDPATIDKDACIMLARQKTASLFAEACAGPTYVQAPEFADALYAYGNALGIAFQIIDDILDVTRTSEELGKPSCGDVAEGKQTIPILYLREALHAEDCAHFDALSGKALSETDQGWIIAQMERSGARDRAFAEARQFADQALDALSVLPATACRESMEGLVEFVLVRGH